jgi:hypothetical protein
LVETLRTPTNKAGFLLQLGYFKASGRFFAASSFHQSDIEFIAGRLEVPIERINFGKYSYTSFERHQDIILNYLGFRKFDDEYFSLAEIITNALKLFERQLVSHIKNELDIEQKGFLDNLLEINEEYLFEEKKDLLL